MHTLLNSPQVWGYQAKLSPSPELPLWDLRSDLQTYT